MLKTIRFSILFGFLFISSTVIAQSPYDIGVDSILTPVGSCDGYQDSLRVRVQNYGTNQVDSFMLYWDINGVTGSMWVNSVLAPATGASFIDLAVDTFLMNPGVFNIDTWTELPNNQADSDILNDSSSFADSIEIFHVEFTFCTSGNTFYFINQSTGCSSFAWGFGDGSPINIDVDPNHVYPWSNGSINGYTVTLTGYNSCGDGEFLIDTVGFGPWPHTGQNPCSWVNGIAVESRRIDMEIFPNPNNGIFTLQLKIDIPKPMNVEVFDVTGVLVFTQDLGVVSRDKEQVINLKTKAKGIYILKLYSDSQSILKRFVIH